MTNPWTNVTGVVGNFNRAANSIIAAFQGRATTRTISAFFGVSAQSLDVQFVDQSSSVAGAIVAWSWTFGDGGVSTEQNPTHTYALEGSYLVTLVITDASGLFASASVLVNAVDESSHEEDPVIPIAAFAQSPSGLTVTFTDQSTDANGSVVAWEWDFGERPTSAFSPTIAGLSVTFTDQSTAPAPLTVSAWSWAFGDNSGSTAQSPVHSYSSGGGKTVTLKATASNGETNTLSKTVSLVSSGVGSGSTSSLGMPFGMTNSFAGPTTLRTNIAASGFRLVRGSDAPSQIVDRIEWARTNGYQLVLAMTGGSPSNYLTNGVFDRSKWNAKQDTFNTPTIKAAIALGVEDDTIKGAGVMDEPFNLGNWGPAGTMTKAKIDDMARYVKAIFPTLPVGVDHASNMFQPNSSYTIIDYIWASYSAQMGNLVTWRDANLAMCARDHHQVVFGFNVLSSGSRTFGCTTSAAVCCPEPATQGQGGQGGNGFFCRPTATQMKSYGTTLGPFGSGLMIWWWDDTTMNSGSYVAANVSAFTFLASALSKIPVKSWRRTD